MVCCDPNGRGYGTAAPEWTAGPGRAACVLPRHNAWAKDVDSPFGLHHPNRKCSHFSWERGHLALADATRAGCPHTQAPGCAGLWPALYSARVEPIVWRISTPWWGVGAGLKPAPTMHAVTGMIGATTTGERVRIAPGSAGILPSASGRSCSLAHLHTSAIYVYPIAAFARKKR